MAALALAPVQGEGWGAGGQQKNKGEWGLPSRVGKAAVWKARVLARRIRGGAMQSKYTGQGGGERARGRAGSLNREERQNVGQVQGGGQATRTEGAGVGRGSLNRGKGVVAAEREGRGARDTPPIHPSLAVCPAPLGPCSEGPPSVAAAQARTATAAPVPSC